MPQDGTCNCDGIDECLQTGFKAVTAIILIVAHLDDLADPWHRSEIVPARCIVVEDHQPVLKANKMRLTCNCDQKFS